LPGPNGRTTLPGGVFHGSTFEEKHAMANVVHDLFTSKQAALADAWLADLRKAGWGEQPFAAANWETQARDLLVAIGEAARAGTLDPSHAAAGNLRNVLEALSRDLASRGATSAQTATFTFSLKRPVFALLREATAGNAGQLADESWAATEALDRMGLFTVMSYQRSREDIIRRQQEELLELSTPVVKLWDGVLALPMIGTLDSSRTQVVMESLLQRIVETGSDIAIIDITGVPTVDTLVAQHLLKTVTAIRLMGADCIISGIRPQIAQTIVHLGIDLQGITTKATLADALTLALSRSGFAVSRKAGS
jgi:rsbT co-antagonist protein RsbR